MTRETLLAVLRQHPFVEEFQPQHIEKLTSLAKEVEFDRDQVIFHEGDDCHDFYLIVAGRTALEIEAPGHTLRVQTLSAGDEFGWSAILMGRGKHFQARALERVEGARLRRRGAAGCVPRRQVVRLRAHVSDAGCRVGAPAGHAAAASRHVLAGCEASGYLTGLEASPFAPATAVVRGARRPNPGTPPAGSPESGRRGSRRTSDGCRVRVPPRPGRGS